MKAKIIEVLNIFIKISGEKHMVPDLLEELSEIEKHIPQLDTEIAKLKEGMTDDKYFDASSEIIDRNIELSLEKKLSYLNSKLNSLKEQNNEIILKNKNEEEHYTSLNKELSSCQEFVHDLSKFDYEISSNSIQKLIDMENERFDAILNEINSQKENREKVISSTKDINEEIAKLEKTIQSEEDRLKEVKEALESKKSYINEDAKAEDLKQLEDLNNEINKLRDRKQKIVNSITYQCFLISEELDKADPNKEKILDIVNNIVTKLNELPYLSLEDETILTEEYSQLSSQRDELTAVIENKKYSLKNKRPYEIRVDYINQKINNAKDIKEDLESILKFIVNQEIEATIDNLLRLKNEKKELDIIYENNNQDLLSKKYVNELISEYESDLSKALEKARDFKNKIIIQEQEIIKANNEIAEISREKKLQFDLENQAEKERDSQRLQDLIYKIEYLNYRISTGITPNQLLEQIKKDLYSSDATEKELSPQLITTPEPVLEDPLIKNYPQPDPDYTFEKITNNDIDFERGPSMTVSPDSFLTNSSEEEKEFSFSPIDNTGFVSFNDAYDIAK